MRTAIAHGSGGPNPLGTSPSCKAGGRTARVRLQAGAGHPLPGRGKGSRTNIPAPAAGKWFGDAQVGLGDWLGGAPEEFSFLLDGWALHGMALRLKMGIPRGKRPQYCAVRCPRLAHAKSQGDLSVPAEGRTHLRIRPPRLYASGRWNNVAKGSRQNGCVPSEKALAPRAGAGAPCPASPRCIGSTGWPARPASRRALCLGSVRVLGYAAARNRPTWNCYDPGESNCLIET